MFLMGTHQIKVLYLNFAHLIRKVSFAVVQVHRALLKASLQALRGILQHVPFGIVHWSEFALLHYPRYLFQVKALQKCV